jgi:hypothetical protein
MNEDMQHPMNHWRDPDHLSYLLRLWRVEGLQGCEWRASLESAETGKRIGFSSLEQLFGYLMDLIERKKEVRESEDQP